MVFIAASKRKEHQLWPVKGEYVDDDYSYIADNKNKLRNDAIRNAAYRKRVEQPRRRTPVIEKE